jgi:hypothetical protein
MKGAIAELCPTMRRMPKNRRVISIGNSQNFFLARV